MNNKAVIALLGAAAVVIVMLAASFLVQRGPDTAEIAEPERTDTVQDTPAGRAIGNEQPLGNDSN
ncbi:MAG TPA: hypothetical protein VFY63_14665 [Pseudorhizobium sp.]|nr:hypothetical protein [Pseudorhizobium sp.]